MCKGKKKIKIWKINPVFLKWFYYGAIWKYTACTQQMHSERMISLWSWNEPYINNGIRQAEILLNFIGICVFIPYACHKYPYIQ